MPVRYTHEKIAGRTGELAGGREKYSGELDSEIFGIDDEEVTSIGPLAFDLHVQRFEMNCL